NTLLVKLEVNTPAGSEKYRPRQTTVSGNELGGAIGAGDTLRAATSGKPGLALALSAGIKGCKMLLIVLHDSTDERKAAITDH
ncbi:cysteine synthase B, partial [Pseudomonas aeruginosa]